MRYLRNTQKRRYDYADQRRLAKLNSLNYEFVQNGYVLPTRHDPSGKRMMGLGGVLDEKFEFKESTVLKSGGSYIEIGDDSQMDIYMGGLYEIDRGAHYDHLDRVVYLGNIYNHWGHFLIDFSTRLWFLKQHPDLSGIYIVKENENYVLIENIKRFLELYGVVDRVTFVNKIISVSNLYVPQPSYITNLYYSNEFLEMFDTVADHADPSAKIYGQVYLTRTGFNKAKKTEFGEDVIERNFANAGFKVISPEQCSLDEQISIIRNAKHIAAVCGTITHNMLFATEKIRITIINKTYVLNVMQMDINRMRNLNVDYVDAFESPFPISLGIGPFLFKASEQLSEFFEYVLHVSFIKDEESENNFRQYLKSFTEKYYTEYQETLNYQDDYNSVHYYDRMLSNDNNDIYDSLTAFKKAKRIYFRSKISMIRQIKHFLGK